MSWAGFFFGTNTPGVVSSVTGTNGVTASPTTGNVVVSGVNATTSSVGVASFNPAQFTVTAGAVSLTSPGQFPWTDVSGAFISAIYNGYFVVGSGTTTLPASPSQGNVIEYIVGNSSNPGLVITAAPGQQIRIDSNISSVGGTATNSAIGSSVELIFRAANSVWYSGDNNGSWLMT